MATLDISNRRSFNWCRSFWNDLGWLYCTSNQKRSHIVITTIMFNFIAAGVLNFFLVDVLKPTQYGSSISKFSSQYSPPYLSDIAGIIGFEKAFRSAPANVSFSLHFLPVSQQYVIWRTPLGYEIRALGKSGPAARYAGVGPVKIIMIAMMISGALCGMMAINTTQGESERLILNFTEGAGFVALQLHSWGVVTQ